MNEENIEKDMTPILLEDLGMRFATEKSKEKKRYGLYQCQYCGASFKGMVSHIRTGHKRSCGCQSTKYKNPHGLHHHRMYKTWSNMIHRCSDPNFKQYEDYGGRGIIVCDEWQDIKNFIDWVENTSNWEEGLTLDRINTNGNYSPDNCTFSNRTIQSINQRIQSSNTSGYVGVCWVVAKNRWKVRVQMYGKCKHIGYFHNLEDAVKARDEYILANNLPHPLSTDEN